jgi:hypothetical protein
MNLESHPIACVVRRRAWLGTKGGTHSRQPIGEYVSLPSREVKGGEVLCDMNSSDIFAILSHLTYIGAVHYWCLWPDHFSASRVHVHFQSSAIHTETLVLGYTSS